MPGRPIPQGSLKFINGRPIHHRATDLAAWRADVARVAQQHSVKCQDGPVTLDLLFCLLKPRTVKRDFPHVRPDLDKLVRAVMDGLTGVAYEDDQQVCTLAASKIYAPTTGVFIRIGDGTFD